MPIASSRLRILKRVILVVALVLYLGAIVPVWRTGKDSALYMLLGRSLAEGRGFALWGAPHVNVPPGYPLMLAGVRVLTGGAVVFLNAAMALCGLAALYLSWRVARRFTGPILSVWLGAVFVLNFEFLDKSTETLSDIPFTLFTLGSFLLVQRFVDCNDRRRGVAGVLTAAASGAVRVVGFPFAAGLGAGLCLEGLSRRRSGRLPAFALLFVLLTAASCLLAGWFYSAYRAEKRREPTSPGYGHTVKTAASRSPAGWVKASAAGAWETGEHLARLFTGQRLSRWAGALLFWLPLLAGTWRSVRRRRYLLVCACWGYFGALAGLKHVLTRYMIPIAPMLFVLEVEGLRTILGKLFARRPRRALAIPIVLGILALMNGVLVIGQEVRLHRVWPGGEPWSAWSHEHGVVGTWLNQHTPRDAKFVTTTSAWTLAWLSDRPAFPIASSVMSRSMPAEDLVALADAQGVTWWVIDRERIPAAFAAIADTLESRPGFARRYCFGRLTVYERTPSSP